MKLNKASPVATTHEGGPADGGIPPILALRRRVATCLLWEKTLYEDGELIAKDIQALIPRCKPREVADLAIEARTQMKLRHVPMLLVRELARVKGNGPIVEYALHNIIQRADELSEFLALYWKEGKTPIANAVKRGLASAFGKFNEYQLAKYNRDSKIKLRDVMFLCHPKPLGKAQEALWKRLVDGELATPDTWEVALSGGANKRETFTRLLEEKKLGGIAVLRNLRNMIQAGVEHEAIHIRLQDGIKGALPFQFVTAARYAPTMEPALEAAMFMGLEGLKRLEGRTGLLVDVSGSMDYPLAARGETTRIDAAAGLAILLREISDCRIATFSEKTIEIPARRGFALRDAITHSQAYRGTYLKRSLMELKPSWSGLDRLIVITDEQSHDGIAEAYTNRAYVVNVAPYKQGVGINAGWTKIDGWSEQVVEFMKIWEELY